MLLVWSAVLLGHPEAFAKARNDVVSQVMDSIEERFEKSKLSRDYSKEDHAKKNGFMADPSKSKVMTLINADALLSVLKDKEFKNQHQTEYSGGGGYDPKQRYNIESNLAGLKLKTLVKDTKELHQLLPKYGMVEFHDFAQDPHVQKEWSESIHTAEALDTFGEIAIYFKDGIRNRTTVTPEDSGNWGAKIKANELVQSLRQKRVIIDFHQAEGGEFFEAQIWGKITLSDIDYVVLPKELFYDNSAELSEVRKALKAAGITYYMQRNAKTASEKSQEALRIRFKGSKAYGEKEAPSCRRIF